MDCFLSFLKVIFLISSASEVTLFQDFAAKATDGASTLSGCRRQILLHLNEAAELQLIFTDRLRLFSEELPLSLLRLYLAASVARRSEMQLQRLRRRRSGKKLEAAWRDEP